MMAILQISGSPGFSVLFFKFYIAEADQSVLHPAASGKNAAHLVQSPG